MLRRLLRSWLRLRLRLRLRSLSLDLQAGGRGHGGRGFVGRPAAPSPARQSWVKGVMGSRSCGSVVTPPHRLPATRCALQDMLPSPPHAPATQQGPSPTWTAGCCCSSCGPGSCSCSCCAACAACRGCGCGCCAACSCCPPCGRGCGCGCGGSTCARFGVGRGWARGHPSGMTLNGGARKPGHTCGCAPAVAYRPAVQRGHSSSSPAHPALLLSPLATKCP